MEVEMIEVVPGGGCDRGDVLREPDEVAALVRLKALGWGVRRIARELGRLPTTVRRDVAAGGWTPYRTPDRPSGLAGLEDWLATRLRRHRGNADVVRQDLEREPGLKVSLRAIRRAVSPHRRELAAPAEEGGAGDGALRDACGPPASGGFRRAADAGRRRERPGVSVRGDAGVLATPLCAGVPA